MNKPYVIGVCGPSCSGKTTTVNLIRDRMEKEGIDVTVLSQDRYYKNGGTPETNFDRPDALEWPLMEKDLKNLINGETVKAPVYDFTTHSRTGTDEVKPSSIIIVEGILIFTQPSILSLLNLKVFISSFNELCFARRVKRDVKERGRDVEEVTNRYCDHVFPSIREYLEPSEDKADVVLKNNKDGKFIGVPMLLDHIYLQSVRDRCPM